MKRFHLYTDGACHPNPGIGGWAFLLVSEENQSEIVRTGNNVQTTNNRMEIQAMLEGLKYFKENLWTGTELLIAYSDSAYVINGITQWIDGWVRKGWRSSSKKEVLNPDLWKQLLPYRDELKPSFKHVLGHNGHPENERVDQLAVEARKLIL